MLTQLVLAFFLLIGLEGAEAQQIDSPTALVQCSPSRLTFSGGVPPYIIDGKQGFPVRETRTAESRTEVQDCIEVQKRGSGSSELERATKAVASLAGRTAGAQRATESDS